MTDTAYGSPRSRGRRLERSMTVTKKTSRPFTHIDTWVFDLDNTLYPHHVNLWQQVDARIGEYIGAFLKVSPQEARRILTNGSTDHADAVLARLGIGAHFEAVFDIIAAELEPKPAPQTYDKFLRLHGVEPTRSAMFEDLARNLVVPHQLGMTTVLVVPDGTEEVVREDWELEGRDA